MKPRSMGIFVVSILNVFDIDVMRHATGNDFANNHPMKRHF